MNSTVDTQIQVVSSINDTARIARRFLGFLVAAILYSVIILVLSSDENILRNSLFPLPSLPVSVPLKHVYIFSPPFIVCMQIVTLYWIRQLARKVNDLYTILQTNPGDVDNTNHFNYLHSMVELLVYVRRDENNIDNFARTVVHFLIIIAPILCLFLLDLSFLRYQSPEITYFHHSIFLIDLVLMAWILKPLCTFHGPRWFKVFGVLRSFDQEHSTSTSAAYVQYTLYSTIVIVVAILTLTLLLYAHVPKIGSKFSHDQWKTIQGMSTLGGVAVVTHGKNALDVGLCPFIRIACRGLSLADETLLLTNQFDDDLSTLVGDKNAVEAVRAKYGLDLSSRNLRFSDFRSAYLVGADLRNADLSGGILSKARLNAAILDDADASGTTMISTELNFTSMERTKLHGARLDVAEMLEANLRFTKFTCLAIGDNTEVCSKMLSTQFVGSDLRGADFTSADLTGAYFVGADLGFAVLTGANLKTARLIGTHIEGAKFDNVVLNWAALFGSFGVPASYENLSTSNTFWTYPPGCDPSSADSCVQAIFMPFTFAFSVDGLPAAWNSSYNLKTYLNNQYTQNPGVPGWLQQFSIR